MVIPQQPTTSRICNCAIMAIVLRFVLIVKNVRCELEQFISNRMSMNRKSLCFVGITYALIIASAAIFALCGGQYLSTSGMILASTCMFFPLIATVVMQVMEHKPIFRGLGIRWSINRWWFVGWLLFPLLSVLAVVVGALLPGVTANSDLPIVQSAIAQMNESMPPDGPQITVGLFWVINLVSALLAGITINALFAFGEEIGWRGYLLQQFNGQSFWKASLLIGAIWGIWHAPIILMGHNYPQHPVAGVGLMILFCMAISPILTWLRMKSKSVVVTAIAHGTLNASAGFSLLCLSGGSDLLTGMTGCVGIGLCVLVDVLIYLFDKPKVCLMSE